MEKPDFNVFRRQITAAIAHPFTTLAWILSRPGARFTVVGLAATAAYFLLGFLFVGICRLPVLLGNALAYALSFAVSYIGQSKYTFQAQGSHSRMLPAYMATQGIGLLLNTCVVGFCVKARLPYILSMFIATAITPVAVYLLCKYWVFRKREPEGQTREGQP